MLAFSVFFLDLGAIFLAEELADAVLEVLFESTGKLVAICVYFNTLSIHFAIFELSFIGGSIWIGEHTLSSHLVILEVTFVEWPAVGEVVLSLAVEHAILEIAFVVVAIELKLSLSRLFAVRELPSKLNGILVPALNSFAMVKVIFPLTLVHGAVVANEYAETVGSTVLEFTLINVTVCVGHPSFSVEEAVLCLPAVNRVVSKLDRAKALINFVLVISGPEKIWKKHEFRMSAKIK